MRRTLLLFSMLAVFPATTIVVACGGDGGSGGSGGSGASGGGTSTSTSTSTSSGMTSTSSSSSGSMGGACTNMADLAIVMSKDVASIAGACAQMNFGNDAATKQCIKDQTSLSDPCIVCFSEVINCVVANCLTECFSDPNSAPCVMCRAAKCDPAFEMCSGLTPPPPDGGTGDGG